MVHLRQQKRSGISVRTYASYARTIRTHHLQSVPQVYLEVGHIMDGKFGIGSYGHRRSDAVCGAQRVLLSGDEEDGRLHLNKGEIHKTKNCVTPVGRNGI